MGFDNRQLVVYDIEVYSVSVLDSNCNNSLVYFLNSRVVKASKKFRSGREYIPSYFYKQVKLLHCGKIIDLFHFRIPL